MFLMAVSLSVIGQLLVIYFLPLQTVFQTEALYITGKSTSVVTDKLRSNRFNLLAVLRRLLPAGYPIPNEFPNTPRILTTTDRPGAYQACQYLPG